jgi:hypothetical protein
MKEAAGVEAEFEGLALGDGRLERRARSIISRATAAPSQSFPALLPTSAELEGAYRFFQNESVSPEALMLPHIQATLARAKASTVVRIAHDTTALSFGGDREGLGTLARGGCGFWAQFALAISGGEERVPFGVLGLETKVYPTLEEKKRIHEELVRQFKASKKERGFPLPPTVWKGVEKWTTIPLRLRKKLKGVRVIHLMDQEADNFEVLEKLKREGFRFVIRGSASRRIGSSTDGHSLHVGDQLAQGAVVVTRQVKLTARPKATLGHPRRDEREATLSMRALRITLKPMGSGGLSRAKLPLNVVEVMELNPPEGEEPINWVLYTTESIGTPEAVATVVDHYRARWRIEEYFKALKTGCSIEKRQLTDFDALMRALALFIPIAWHLLALRAAAHQPEAIPAAKVTTALQVTVLRALVKEREIELSPEPSAREVLWGIAALGGHLKRNGEPGWITLGRGYDKLRSAESVWRLAIASSERSDQS